jgi:hypothetical protein
MITPRGYLGFENASSADSALFDKYRFEI